MMERVANTGMLPREDFKPPYGTTRASPEPNRGPYKRKPREHRLDRMEFEATPNPNPNSAQ